jgi:hypothetical protein
MTAFLIALLLLAALDLGALANDLRHDRPRRAPRRDDRLSVDGPPSHPYALP